MQVSYSEGLANHTGPESCVGIREDAGEALTGERIGQPSSRESLIFPDADVVRITEGNMGSAITRAPAQSAFSREEAVLAYNEISGFTQRVQEEILKRCDGHALSGRGSPEPREAGARGCVCQWR